ncbi:MAG TPA: hypothetical protein VF981_06295 [Gemmatimonadaceae bacterium]
MTIYPGDVALAAVIFGTVSGTILALTRMRYRYLEQREHYRSVEPAAVEERLLRIEQAVDAIAVEVERMSESQRFTSNLLVDRLPPRSPGRVLEGGNS